MTLRERAMQTPPSGSAGARSDACAGEDRAPLVSVIMIFLDAERFIEEAIASVFAQTWPHWELLLVDDGSTDRSTAIAGRYAAAHPERVRYLEHPGHANRGMSASRNLGIAHAYGSYIAFLDADDVYLPERLARHVEVLERYDEVDVVQSGLLRWHSWAGAKPDQPEVYLLDGCPIVAPPTLLGSLVGTLPLRPPGICSLTIRASALSRIGTSEGAFRGIYEDQVLAAKIYTRATVYLLDHILARYRQHPQSSCETAMRTGAYHTRRPNPSADTFFSWLSDYLAAQQVPDQAIRDAVTAKLRPYRHPLTWRVRDALSGIAQLPWAIARVAAHRLLPEAAFRRLRQLHRHHARTYRLQGLYGPLHIRMPSDGS